MLRAGHGFDAARALIDAANLAEAERWTAEAREEEES
jgi:regulatory protein